MEGAMPLYRISYPNDEEFLKNGLRVDSWIDLEAANDEDALKKAKERMEVRDVQGFHLSEIRHFISCNNKTWSGYRDESSRPRIQTPEWEERKL
jgi:hypothetical protein